MGREDGMEKMQRKGEISIPTNSIMECVCVCSKTQDMPQGRGYKKKKKPRDGTETKKKISGTE